VSPRETDDLGEAAFEGPQNRKVLWAERQDKADVEPEARRKKRKKTTDSSRVYVYHARGYGCDSRCWSGGRTALDRSPEEQSGRSRKREMGQLPPAIYDSGHSAMEILGCSGFRSSPSAKQRSSELKC